MYNLTWESNAPQVRGFLSDIAAPIRTGHWKACGPPSSLPQYDFAARIFFSVVLDCFAQTDSGHRRRLEVEPLYDQNGNI